MVTPTRSRRRTVLGLVFVLLLGVAVFAVLVLFPLLLALAGMPYR